MGIRSTFRAATSGVAAVFLLPLAFDGISERIWKDPTAVVTWAQSIFGESGFYWLVFATCGLCLGAWLDVVFDRLDRARYAELLGDIDRFQAEVLQNGTGSNDRTMMLLSQAAAIERQLEQHGIAAFDCAKGTNKPTTVYKCAMVYQQIAPFLRAGNRTRASKIVGEFNSLEKESENNIGKFEVGERT
ncbi:hypothetical protein [Sphingobium yanoikuyae]|uniref:hypothetical protein n=1 Tax=Sphingobium yanoikuyae TaxID=13690 RepID=UPI00242B5E22|nr:hypothetical protein [Sphingobium yanoikuyae]